MTISEIFNCLSQVCVKARQSINEVRKPNYFTDPVLIDVREMTIKQAFLNVFSEWEHFLENSTIAFSMGEENLSGFKPNKYISPLDEEHAHRLIKGSSAYPDWSDLKSVKDIASRLFEQGEPYKSALNGFSSKFSEMKKVRNIIVHNSAKSKAEFDTLVRNALRASDVGISAVDFLLSRKGSNPYFFDVYISHVENAATFIANYTSVNS